MWLGIVPSGCSVVQSHEVGAGAQVDLDGADLPGGLAVVVQDLNAVAVVEFALLLGGHRGI